MLIADVWDFFSEKDRTIHDCFTIATFLSSDSMLDCMPNEYFIIFLPELAALHTYSPYCQAVPFFNKMDSKYQVPNAGLAFDTAENGSFKVEHGFSSQNVISSDARFCSAQLL